MLHFCQLHSLSIIKCSPQKFATTETEKKLSFWILYNYFIDTKSVSLSVNKPYTAIPGKNPKH